LLQANRLPSNSPQRDHHPFPTRRSSDLAKIDGTKILLNSPSSSTDDEVEPPPPPTEIELVDEKGKPLPNQRFIATYDDGTVISGDRKSTRLNSSHLGISYAVFCLKKKKT